MAKDDRKRLHRESIPPEWEKALLQGQAPAAPAAPVFEDGDTLYQRIEKLQQALEATIQVAQAELSGHALAQVVIESVLRANNKRGSGTLTMGESGKVYIELTYKQRTRGKAAAFSVEKPVTLDELRKRAQALGIDTAPFGRSKKNILAAIKAKENELEAAPEEAPEEAPPKQPMMRTADSVTPPQVVTFSGNGTKPKPNLRALAEQAKELDLDDILGNVGEAKPASE